MYFITVFVWLQGRLCNAQIIDARQLAKTFCISYNCNTEHNQSHYTYSLGTKVNKCLVINTEEKDHFKLKGNLQKIENKI